MDEMVLSPATGLRESQTRQDMVPWLNKKRKYRFTATIGWAMFQPERLARALPADSSVAQALGFAALANTIFLILGIGVVLAIGLGMAFLGAATGGRAGPTIAGILVGGVATLVVLPAGFLLILFLWSLVTHGLLSVLGSPVGGLKRTVESLAYSSGANILTGIPCLGVYASMVSWIWWVVSGSIMVCRLHRVRGWVAAVAVALPPLIAMGTFIGLMIWMIVGPMRSGIAASAAMTASTPITTAIDASARVTSLSAAMPGPSASRAKSAEILRLVGTGKLPVDLLVSSDSKGQRDALSTEAVWLRSLAKMNEDERAAAIEQAVHDLGDGTMCFRMGDFVIVCDEDGAWEHAQGAGGVWVVVCIPKQLLAEARAVYSQTTGASGNASVGMSGAPVEWVAFAAATRAGGTDFLTGATLPGLLTLQNTTRKGVGLPPLPDLMTIPEVKIPPDLPTVGE
ncbi:MAG TPA: hypothetical protein VG797_10270 [Phycisphaerales bacterium]|nr:hypothetical protein [Phycisphaerales bacterium]